MNPYKKEANVQDSYRMHSDGAMLYFLLILYETLYIFAFWLVCCRERKKAQ